jgi:uncharacterized protein YbjQ (UPF0145 family)
MGQVPSKPVNTNTTSTPTPATPESTETEYQRELSSLVLDSKKAVPSKLNRFRVKVPPSMAPGDIMTIKLNGVLTKILIATPTTSSTNTSQAKVVDLPSRAATSCDSTSSSSDPSPSRIEPTPTETKTIDSVFASNDARVPEGKMIVEAKPVIVVHAIFSQQQQEEHLKDQMADEAMREIIQETVDSGCNAILGMTVTIKKQSEGYLVKACGTPCILMPAQVLLAPPRKRTSSTELLPMRRP